MRLLFAATLTVMAALSANASELYSVFYDNRFGIVDDTNGSYSQISTLPIATAAGVAYENGDLYVQSMSGTLLEVDPISGVSTVIGNSGLQLTSVVFAGGSDGLFEIDYSSNLYSINSSTGAATKIGATGLPANNGGWDTSLSYSNGILYFTGGGPGQDDILYSINLATGHATDLGDTGVSGIAGSAIVNGNLELFQYHWSGATDYIYSASLGSTNFSEIAQLRTQVVDGAIPIGFPADSAAVAMTTPEPFSLLLLGLGLILLGILGTRHSGRFTLAIRRHKS